MDNRRHGRSFRRVLNYKRASLARCSSRAHPPLEHRVRLLRLGLLHRLPVNRFSSEVAPFVLVVRRCVVLVPECPGSHRQVVRKRFVDLAKAARCTRRRPIVVAGRKFRLLFR